MEVLTIDTYNFFDHWADLYTDRLNTMNKRLSAKFIFNHSVGYGLEDREELFDFLTQYMITLRDQTE